jgi:hypothetical protein
MILTDRSHLVRPPRPTPIARIVHVRKTLRAIAKVADPEVALPVRRPLPFAAFWRRPAGGFLYVGDE